MTYSINNRFSLGVLGHRWGSLGAVLAMAFALALTGGEAVAQSAPKWTVDMDKSELTFTASQSGSPIDGVFEKFTALIAFDPANLDGSSVDITIDMASVNTQGADRDQTIRSPDLFDVKTWPTGSFKAASFTKTDAGFDAVAQLTMRDVTKDVTLPFTLDIVEENGVLVAKAVGEITVKRLEYGVGQGQGQDTATVADDVVIGFDLTATRPIE